MLAWITCFLPDTSMNLQVSSSTDAEITCNLEFQDKKGKKLGLFLPVMCFWERCLYGLNFSFEDVETSHLGWLESELDIKGNHGQCFHKTNKAGYDFPYNLISLQIEKEL